MISRDEMITEIIEAKFASNIFQAGHIADGLQLFRLNTKKARLERVALYRKWRTSKYFPAKDTASCFEKAIKGEEVPQMELSNVTVKMREMTEEEVKEFQSGEWDVYKSRDMEGFADSVVTGTDKDEGLELADYFDKIMEEEEE